MDATVLGSLKVQILGGTLEDKETGATLVVDSRKRVIGRAVGCDLRVDDRGVSATHLEVFATERGVVVRDTGSKNGTWIGRTRVAEVYLTGPESIRIGNRVLSFVPGPKKEHALPAHFGALRSSSPTMRAVFEQLQSAARGPFNVHLTGESGTGKTRIAREIHAKSARSKGPFVVIDCGSTPASLMESALFGHVKGAFTGAEAKQSPFVLAKGGTVFIDEIGDLPEEQQKTLLRVLDEKVIQPVGSARDQKVDVRIITGTLHDLQARVNQKKGFRNDLFFRLGMRIEIPPLRERLEDLGAIVEQILRDLGQHELFSHISARALDRMRERAWPGNVRDVRDVLSFAVDAWHATGEIDLDSAYTTWFRADRGPASHPRDGTADDSADVREHGHPVNRLIADGATLDKVEEAARRLLLERLNAECEGVVSEIARRAGISLPYARRELARLSLRAIEPPPRWMRLRTGGRK